MYKTEGHFNSFGLVAVGSLFFIFIDTMLKELSLSLTSGEITNDNETFSLGLCKDPPVTLAVLTLAQAKL